MLEKVEQPKRKRGERGEETAQDVIVKDLTQKRIEELRKEIEKGNENLRRLKSEKQVLEASDEPPAEFLNMLLERKRTEEAEAAAAAIRHQQWLIERKAKIAAALVATRKGLLRPVRSQHASAAPVTPTGPVPVKSEETVPVSAAVTVDTQDETSDSAGPTTPVSQNPPLPSPLLTHLLQSPSSSTTPYKDAARQPESVSPSKAGSAAFFSNQTSLTATPARQPVPSPSQSVSSSPAKVAPADETAQSASQAPSASPTLSKLLELPLSSASANKLPPLPDSGKHQDQEIVDLCDDAQDGTESSDQTDTQRNDAGDVRSAVKTEPKESEKSEDSVSKSNEADGQEIKTPVTRRLRGRPAGTPSLLAITAAPGGSVSASHTPQPASPVTTASSTPAGTVVSGSASVATRRSGRIRGIRDVSESDSMDKKPVIEDSNLMDASASEESSDAITRPAASSKAPSISDSIPNSPASTMHSEDTDADRDRKRWQRAILSLLKNAMTHPYAHVFLHPAHKEVGDDYLEVVKRPVDLTSIKKRLENQSAENAIRTTAEFQREMMLLFQNALMYNRQKHEVYEMAIDMQKEIGDEIDAFIKSEKELQKEQAASGQPSTSGGKTGSSQSETPAVAKQRIRSDRRTPASVQTQDDASNRRRSRTSTDTDPGTPGTSVPLTRTALKKKANA
jgi:bromodomain-containing protein 8